jgi:O-antigen ligase
LEIFKFAAAGSWAPIRLPKIAIIFLALTGIVLVQVLIGDIRFFGDGLTLVFYFALAVLAMGAGFNLASARMELAGIPNRCLSYTQYMAIGLLVASAVSVVLCLAQAFSIWGDAEWIARLPRLRRPGGNLGQPNQLATLLVMGIASLAFLSETKKLSALTASCLYFLLLVGVALTESRSGLLSCMALAVWWFARRRSASFNVSAGAVLSGIVLLPVLLWVWPLFFGWVQAGGLIAGTEWEPMNVAAGVRLVIWPQLIEAILQRPWFGWGLREVSTAHNAVLHAYSLGEPFTYAHNILLDLAVGLGIPLTLIICALSGHWFIRRIRQVQTTHAWYCVALIVPLGIHSMVEFPFAYAYFLVPLCFAAGILEGLLAPSKAIQVNWLGAAIVFCATTLVMAWSLWEYVVMEEDFRVARFEVLRIGQTPTDYVHPDIYLLTQLAALNEVSRLVPVSGMSAERIAMVRKVAMRFPWTATQNRYALVLALNGNPVEAKRQLLVMRAMHGEKNFKAIQASWVELARTKYPQLAAIAFP